jgi:hypothetical protein
MLISRRRETARGSVPRPAEAASEDARLLHDKLSETLAEIQTVQRSVALGELWESFSTAAKPGWDGDEGAPITVPTYVTARDFLRSLPAAYPSPEVAALDDGTIALDWFPAPDMNFSVVVYPDRSVVFASAGPRGVLKGAYRFDGEVPEPIVDELRRVY